MYYSKWENRLVLFMNEAAIFTVVHSRFFSCESTSYAMSKRKAVSGDIHASTALRGVFPKLSNDIVAQVFNFLSRSASLRDFCSLFARFLSAKQTTLIWAHLKCCDGPFRSFPTTPFLMSSASWIAPTFCRTWRDVVDAHETKP